jgi:hypothetical protein
MVMFNIFVLYTFYTEVFDNPKNHELLKDSLWNFVYLRGHNNNPRLRSVFYAFYLSKYVEFWDTYQLVLLGKKPILLQKYHHFGAVLVWWLDYVNNCDAILIPTMFNAVVHFFMYFFYFLTSLKVKVPKPLKMSITVLQLVQLTSGCYVVHHFYNDNATQTEVASNNIFITYVIILIALFVQFFQRTYLSKPKREDKQKRA